MNLNKIERSYNASEVHKIYEFATTIKTEGFVDQFFSLVLFPEGIIKREILDLYLMKDCTYRTIMNNYPEIKKYNIRVAAGLGYGKNKRVENMEWKEYLSYRKIKMPV